MSGSQLDIEEWRNEPFAWSNVRLREFGTVELMLQVATSNMQSLAWSHALWATGLTREEAETIYDKIVSEVESIRSQWKAKNYALAWGEKTRILDHLVYAKKAAESSLRLRNRCQTMFEQALPTLKESEFWQSAAKKGFSSD